MYFFLIMYPSKLVFGMQSFHSAIFLIILNAFYIYAQSYNDVKRLHDEVLNTQRYNPSIKPSNSPDKGVVVDVNLFLLSIYGVEEKSQTITGDVYWEITWTDSMLAWNVSEYNGTYNIYVPIESVWMPDIVVSNGVGSSKFLSNNLRTDHVSVLSDGTVGWWPTGDVTIQCAIVLTKFPFDIQNCYYEIEQWYMEWTHMILTTSTTGPSLKYYRLNDAWDITHTGIETDVYADGFGNYSAVRFNISLQRRPSFYVITMLLPVFLLSFLNSFCFLLPPESGEKIGLSISLFLTFVLLLTIVTTEMPSSSRNMFIFEIVIGVQLFSSGINLIIGILIVKAYHTPYFKSVFSIIRWISRKKCRRPTFVCCNKQHTLPIANQEMETNLNSNNIPNIKCDHSYREGKAIAYKMDMLLFKCTFVINLAVAIGFFVTVLS